MSIKKLVLPAFCAFAFLAISVGCKKSNNSTNSTTISASMGSTSFNVNSTNSTAYYSTDSSVFIIGGFAVSNKDTTGVTIDFNTPYTIGTAITDPSMVQIDYFVSMNKDYFAGYGLGHCTVTVTSQDTVNHKIVGTFSGVLYNGLGQNDSLEVTNGKFNTAYSIQQ